MHVVCFDLGGVVVRICKDWHEAARRAGLPGPRSDSFLAPWLVQRRMELLALHQCGAISCSAFFQGLADVSDGNYGPDEVARIHDAWLIGDYDGINEFIDQLNGIPGLWTACLSNTNESHWLRLTANHGTIGVSQAVNRIRRHFASHQLGLIKPHAAIYEQFESTMKVNPASILFFDDTPENIETARARGWSAILIDPMNCTVSQMRDHLDKFN